MPDKTPSNIKSQIEKKIEKYHKSGKEDIEIYYDDDFGNIQRFKARINHWEDEAELKGIKEAISQRNKEISEEIDKMIKWYEDYEKDGEKDRDILLQSKAIASALKELKSSLGQGK